MDGKREKKGIERISLRQKEKKMKILFCKILGGQQTSKSNLKGVCLFPKPLEIPKSCYLRIMIFTNDFCRAQYKKKKYFCHSRSTHALSNGILKEHNLKSSESRGLTLNEFLRGF